MPHEIKKMSLMMVSNEKIIETKKLSPLGINIKFWGWLAGLALVTGLVWACGTTFGRVAGIYLGYKLLKLILRLIGFVFSVVFTVISIIILTIIISLLIF
jgi:hypothetical protein